MWESPEMKRAAYLVGYGGSPDGKLRLTDDQLKKLEEWRRSGPTNPCMEIPMGLGKECVLPRYYMGIDPYKEETPKLLLICG